MRTLANYIMDSIRSRATFNRCNLLGLKAGSTLFIKSVMYKVVSVDIIIEELSGEKFTIAEYILSNCETLDDELKEERYHLWVYPSESPDDKYLCLFFKNTFSCDFETARASKLMESVQDPTGEFIIDTTVYERRFGDKQGHKAKKLYSGEFNYWDFNYVSGIKSTDFVFVTESKDGWFDILEGDQVFPENIVVV